MTEETDRQETVEAQGEELEAGTVTDGIESSVIVDETVGDEETAVGVKDYLSESIFNDVRQVTKDELSASEDISELVAPDVLLRYNETISDIAQNQIVQGRVIGQNEKEIIMDIGFKSEGLIRRSEFTDREAPSMGQVLEVYLERMEDENGQTILSKEKADWMKGWLRLIEIHENGETVKGTISRRIKGGMVVDVDGIQAFLPGSQIDVRPVQDFDRYLGEEMEFKVVKVNQLRKNVVLSRKALLEDSLQEERTSFFEEIKVNDIKEGNVKNITDFGVFVDLGRVDGLLHITDLSWGRVKHPSDMIEVGETLTVKVIGVDKEKQRISLGLKQLMPHPWENVPERYPVGTKIKGKVVSLTNYGAFVELETGVEGLVHVSEMSWTRNVHHPSDVAQLGDEVEAIVLELNQEEKKIALGFKQLLPDPWEGVEEKYAVGSFQKGIVRNLTQFGAFVELEEGVDGLVHVSDLSWTKIIRHPREVLQKDQEIEVKVLEVSRGSRRIALGLRQALEDPWPAIVEHFQVGSSVSGEVIRSLEKGVIVDLEMDVEGIIPSRTFPHKERGELLDRFLPEMKVTTEVVEVKPDEKKVILKAVEIPGKKEKGEDDNAEVGVDTAAPSEETEPEVAEELSHLKESESEPMGEASKETAEDQAGEEE